MLTTDTMPIDIGPTSQLPVVVPVVEGPEQLVVEYIPRWLLLFSAWVGAVTVCLCATVVTYLLVTE